ncbi:hypothetical protein [Streptomyces milbemycinicus]|uniref:Uncharacterized protein n=1 Tax=Streptomyces milbemycinicus TaxID=476552 RepID=A0ABW8M394_9ACTN
MRRVLALQHRLDHLIEAAVIAEWERGTTWEQFGSAAGTTRQSAHKKWADDLRSWAANGRSARFPGSARSGLEAAEQADWLYASRHPYGPTGAVTQDWTPSASPARTLTRTHSAPEPPVCTPAGNPSPTI